MESQLMKNIRGYMGFTQQQFADWLGVSLSSIALVEANHRTMSKSLADKIALKFDVQDPDFIAYIERKTNAHDYFFNHYNVKSV